MSRLAFLAGTLLVFLTVPVLLVRAPALPPRSRIRLAGLSLAGAYLASVSLLAALLLPEVLTASRLSDVWRLCSRAFRTIGSAPTGRIPSILGGIGLALLLGRFAWSLAASVRSGRRLRATGRTPRWHLDRGVPVYVLPVDHPEAYSVGCFRRQVVVSRGLLALLDDDERRAFLWHEEGHVRARHHLGLTLARAVAAGLWLLPPVRNATWLLEQAMEEAADDYAASRVGDAATVASGVSRAALAGLRAPAGVPSLARSLDVPARVRRLLSPPTIRPWASAAALVALGLLLGLIALTQALAGLAVVAAAHHVFGFGVALTCPLSRA